MQKTTTLLCIIATYIEEDVTKIYQNRCQALHFNFCVVHLITKT